MYAFGSTGKVQSDGHRQDLIDYIDKKCMPLASKRADNHSCSDECEGEETECPAQDVDNLRSLREYVVNAPIEKVKA